MSARSSDADPETGQSIARSMPTRRSSSDNAGAEANNNRAEANSSQQDARALTSRLRVDRQEIAPPNTGRTYDSPQKEFLEFARIRYEGQLAVTEEKLFSFLWFTIYRDKRPTSRTAYKFSIEDYNQVVAAHPPQRRSQFDGVETRNYNGYKTYERYRSSLLALADQQREEGETGVDDDNVLKSKRVNDLGQLSKSRAPHIARRLFKEKLAAEVAKFKTPQYLAPLEEKFWEHQSHSLNNGVASLRNRCYYLLTLQSAVRGESVDTACLSDFFDAILKGPTEPTVYNLMIFGILTGKTNHNGDRILGRAIRHKIVEMCCQGALGLYLLGRFTITNEDNNFDFTNNENWFNVKLMVDCRSIDNTVSVSSDCYFDAIDAHLKQLGAPKTHRKHFGRSAAPLALELAELNPEVIKQLGHWDRRVYERHYSSNIPFQALRVIAGFSKDQGVHWNPRMHLLPPQHLQLMVFPFVECGFAQLNTLPVRARQEKVTAISFLEMMKNLRVIILQDVACLMLKGRHHIIFDTHPVFQHPDFHRFKQQMQLHLHHAQVSMDPSQQSINQILPHVGTQFHHVQHELRGLRSQQEDMHRNFRAYMQHTEQRDQAFQQWAVAVVRHQASFPLPAPFQVQQHLTQAGTGDTGDTGDTSGTGGTGGTSSEHVTATEGMSPAVPAPNTFPKLRRVYKAISEVYDDWHGRGSSGFASCGGIKKLEQTQRGRWRSSFSQADTKKLSRMKGVVQYIDWKVSHDVEEGENSEKIERALIFVHNAMILQKRLSLSGWYRHIKELEKQRAEEEEAAKAMESEPN